MEVDSESGAEEVPHGEDRRSKQEGLHVDGLRERLHHSGSAPRLVAEELGGGHFVHTSSPDLAAASARPVWSGEQRHNGMGCCSWGGIIGDLQLVVAQVKELVAKCEDGLTVEALVDFFSLWLVISSPRPLPSLPLLTTLRPPILSSVSMII